MPEAIQLSRESINCLRDEAYVYLCRQSLELELASVEAQKVGVMATKPSFAMLASKKSKETFQASFNVVAAAEAGVRQNLALVDRLEHWLASKLQDDLNDYLALTNPEHQLFNQICTLVDRWQSAAAGLGEHAQAFARDNRAATRPGLTRTQSLHAIAILRSATAFLHSEATKIELIADEAARLGEGHLPPGTRLPKLPAFHPSTWVDRAILLPAPKCNAELEAAETEARGFCTGGKNELLIQAEQTRNASLRARQNHLEAYWRTLRTHALKHYVKPRDVAEVLAELTTRYLAGDLERHQLERTKNPFSG